MYDPKLTFLQSELNYRNDRAKSALSANRRSHRTITRGRRHADAINNAR